VACNCVMNEQDEAVEEKVTALLPCTVLKGLTDANWKERLSAMEKMTDVCVCICEVCYCCANSVNYVTFFAALSPCSISSALCS